MCIHALQHAEGSSTVTGDMRNNGEAELSKHDGEHVIMKLN